MDRVGEGGALMGGEEELWDGDEVWERRISEIVDAAMSTGIQSTFFVGKDGMLFIEGWREVENMIFQTFSLFSCHN